VRGKLRKEGEYELFETTKGHQILTLDQKEWYAVVETSQGHILVKSDADHEKDKTVAFAGRGRQLNTLGQSLSVFLKQLIEILMPTALSY
jgi:hypothetical protein